MGKYISAHNDKIVLIRIRPILRLFVGNLLKFIRKPSFLAFVFFLFLTFGMTFPLIFRMNQIIGSASGDGTYFVWLVRWYQKALFELKISPFFNPYMNYPQGWNLATTDTTPAMVALALPGSLLFGPTWGYNFSILGSFVLSGWGMYLWIKSVTKNDWAGLVAGTIFAFLPFRMAHVIVGHLSLAGTQWFPFYFWGLSDLLKQDKFAWKPVLMASFSAGLIGLTSPYYVYMTVIISAFFLLGFIVFRGYKHLRMAGFWKSLLTFGILSILLVGLSMLPYLGLNAQNGIASRSVEYASRYSASPTDFIIPSVWHFLWGDWVIAHFHPGFAHEATLYIGAVTFVLAVIALLWRRKFPNLELIEISLIVAIAAFILALGIDLHWLGNKVVSMPLFLQPIFHRTDMPQIYLPAYYLFRFFPLFSKMRVMMRFGLFTLIFFSLLAGLGAHVLTQSVSARSRRWIAIGLLLLICIDFYPGILRKFSRLDARPVDYWLATQPGMGAVAQFPFSQESSQKQVYNTLVSQKPFLGGYFNANQPEQYERISPVMDGFPSPESADLLMQLGVAYVIVDSSQYSNFTKIDQTIQSLGLKLLHVSDQEYVYGLP
jgi:hypothetical protein